MRAKPDICNAMQLGLERTSRTRSSFWYNDILKTRDAVNCAKMAADATNRGLAMVEAGLLS
jgi:hypothetical protein